MASQLQCQLPYVPYVLKKSYEDIVPRKKYKFLFQSINKCNYIDRYGNKCCNDCCCNDLFDYYVFKHRGIFCWKHIQENIDNIIKLDKFIYNFFLIEKEIEKRMDLETNSIRKEFANNEIIQLFKSIIKLISKNQDLIIMVKDILTKFDSLYYKIFYHGIRIDYDNIIPYDIRVFIWTKCLHHIEQNIREREKTLDNLKEIINTNNDFSDYLHSSNMFESNLIKIIEEYI